MEELNPNLRVFDVIMKTEYGTSYNAYVVKGSEKTALIEKLQKISGKVIEPEFIKDESLIGGIQVQIDDKIFDGSIKNRLNKAKGVISE